MLPERVRRLRAPWKSIGKVLLDSFAESQWRSEGLARRPACAIDDLVLRGNRVQRVKRNIGETARSL